MWFPDHADAWGQMSGAEAMGDAGPQSEVHSTIRSAVHSSSVLLYEFGSEVLKHQNQIGSDVVLGFGPWLSLRTKFQSLVLSLASKE